MSDLISHLPDFEWSLIEGKWRPSLDSVDFKADPALDLLLTLNHTGSLFTADGSFNGRLDSYFPLNLEVDDATAEVVRLAVAVACLHAFLQLNWTGPDLDINTLDLLTIPTPPSIPLTHEILSAQAISELATGGEPAYHLAKLPELVRIAQILLSRGFENLRTGPWWNLRTHLIHQQLLDDPVPVPEHFWLSLAPLERLDDQDLVGRLKLEQGLLRHLFAQDRQAADLFVEAAKVAGLQYQLTGALGKRTKFQTRDLTQLVLLAKSRDDGTDEQNVNVPETMQLNDDTLLEQTEYTSSTGTNTFAGIDPSNQPALRPLDQCIFLGMCLNVRNTSPAHGLTSEQMMPYISRVISHPRNWSVHTMALLLRARLESTRTRTVERSTLQLQALVDQMPTADSTLSERLLYVHSIPLPSKWAMEQELADRFLSIGVVKSALEIFERLEMWEQVVKCYQSIEQRDRALEIVRDLLAGRKYEADVVLARGKTAEASPGRMRMDTAREAKLWCLLGDIDTSSSLEHYNRAWLVSNSTSARAARALGGYYFARGEYSQAIPHLKTATALQPLLSRPWFLMGCAYVREEAWTEARDAFARCVGIDPEDGESWNNIASVYLRMEEKGLMGGEDLTASEDDAAPEPTTDRKFTNKLLAFRALKQGLRYSYENWRMWQNYILVSVEVGELSEACRALGRLVELRVEKDGVASVDIEVLERLVDAVTRAPPDEEPTDAQTEHVRNPNEGHGLFPGVYDLFHRVILPRISNSPRIYRAWARLLAWRARSRDAVHLKATWSDVLTAHMDAYRAGVGSDSAVETDMERFKEAVAEITELVDVLRNLGPRVQDEGGEQKKGSWQFQARSLVRTFMGRTRAGFEDEPEWGSLKELLNELKDE
ncbi:TPR repeat-containing protein C19B12,01 [Schizosaccharomyces pombe 972h-] [Rhizoctonia solani]|uniref:TPR repeat-containing protein C19B12,01 [Schizosaccharomyces pombe 972h-] n=1 Tax=Rhizoctonia solani TaxID=456999 RepID=A0A0K6FNT8_9AGAM|nr:TPR repeat-containing protein C19B12,01 [Schizosaccharomyces pombe 972h-] [Rhizoctonia solani]